MGRNLNILSPFKHHEISVDELSDNTDDDPDFKIDLDEILKRPTDGSKRKEEILDEADKRISKNEREHQEEMLAVDVSIAAMQQKKMTGTMLI